MKDIRIKRHLIMMRICEKGFCDSDFIDQVDFNCKHCLVQQLLNKSRNGKHLTRRGCNEYIAKKIARDYMSKYKKASDVLKK